MREEIVNVEIDIKTGNVQVEAEGFVGDGCDCLNQLELSLGTVTNREEKDERYQYEIPDPVFNQA